MYIFLGINKILIALKAKNDGKMINVKLRPRKYAHSSFSSLVQSLLPKNIFI